MAKPISTGVLDHITDLSDEELRASLVAEVEEKQEDTEDPRDQLTWVFDFSYTDTRGKTWSGVFTNKVLSIGEQQQVSVLRAKFNGAMPIESIDDNMLYINGAIAHMTFSLQGERPEWAKNLRAIHDPMLIHALWEKVGSHETRYFRLEKAEKESAKDSRS